MINRRNFVRAAAATTAAVACPAIVRGQNLNSRLQIAGIGCDGKGYSDIKEMSDHKQTGLVRVYHPWGWRDWQDFGNGALGDFGCHIFDPVFSALQIDRAPLQLKADHSGMNDQVWPAQTTVEHVFAGTKWTTDDTIRVTWYDGGRRPSTKGSHLPENEAIPDQGSLLIGQRGTLVLPHVGRMKLYPQEKYPESSFDELESLNHYHGWVDGCLDGKQPSDGFVYGAKLTESVLLGNIAVRFRKESLKWDEQQMSFTGNDDANKWLTREYRDGWQIQPIV